MKPGHGEVLIAEGDVDLAEDERRLIEEFRRQLDRGLWAAVPVAGSDGTREARMVRSFEDVPRSAERVSGRSYSTPTTPRRRFGAVSGNEHDDRVLAAPARLRTA